ncbi:MAG: hypothetical protein ACE5J6_03985 [Candidatus Bathyarchaeia archaeon]
MTVYEAKTKQHYKKIVDFLLAQPKDSLPFRCMKTAYGKLSLPYLERLKRELPLFVFVVEDKKGNIKGVLFAQTREQEKLVTYVFAYIDHQDWVNNNSVYFDELVSYAIRYAHDYGMEKCESFSNEKFTKWLANLCGNSFKMIESFDTTLGKIYRFTIDIAEYVS